MVRAAEIAHLAARGAEFGIETGVRIDGPAVMRRIHRVMDDGRRFYEDLVARDDGVLLVPARASFVGGRLLLDGKDAGLHGVPTVLAVGAAPATPPIAGAASVPYLTSDALLRLPDLPRSLGIVGGGMGGISTTVRSRRLGARVLLVEPEALGGT